MRLIDADSLKTIICLSICGPARIQPCQCGCAQILAIDNAPTVEAEPIWHGHWNKRKGWHWVMKYSDYGDPICKERKERTFYLCSKCNRRTDTKSAYCPACGVKMDEVELETKRG